MLELLTPSEMSEADRLTIAGGVPGIELMERAGRAVADRIVQLRRPPARVTIVAGPGNNGGDGFVAARYLRDWGFDVRLVLAGERARLKGDAAAAAGRWNGPIRAPDADAFAGAEVIVDALFGAGLDRPVEGAPASLIEAMNAAGVPVIAVDLPSGISGDGGAVLGTAVRAKATVTFFRRKPGHLLLPGRLHCGRVEVADIGIPERVLETIRPACHANAPELWERMFQPPPVAGHKYTRGHAVVVSGGMTATGAARLAARGALRAGAGLVTIASPGDAIAVNAAASLAVMVRRADDAGELTGMLTDPRLNAILLGPGGGVGEGMRQKVRAAIKSGAAVVLDADALTSFTGAAEELRGAAVLTPHEGEFSHLFKEIDCNLQVPSKLEKTRRAARVTGAVVLLKGPDTVIAAADGRTAICENAPPWLATAGAGDVLAGMITGLLAQRMPPFEAAAAAAWLHGEAANAFGPGLVSEDLPEVLPSVLRKLWSRVDVPDHEAWS